MPPTNIQEYQAQLNQRAAEIAQAQAQAESFNPQIQQTQAQLRRQTPSIVARMRGKEYERQKYKEQTLDELRKAKEDTDRLQAEFDPIKQQFEAEQSRIETINSVLRHNAERGSVGSDFQRLSRDDQNLVRDLIREGEDSAERSALASSQGQAVRAVETQLQQSVSPEVRAQIEQQVRENLALVQQGRFADVQPLTIDTQQRFLDQGTIQQLAAPTSNLLAPNQNLNLFQRGVDIPIRGLQDISQTAGGAFGFLRDVARNVNQVYKNPFTFGMPKALIPDGGVQALNLVEGGVRYLPDVTAAGLKFVQSPTYLSGLDNSQRSVNVNIPGFSKGLSLTPRQAELLNVGLLAAPIALEGAAPALRSISSSIKAADLGISGSTFNKLARVAVDTPEYSALRVRALNEISRETPLRTLGFNRAEAISNFNKAFPSVGQRPSADYFNVLSRENAIAQSRLGSGLRTESAGMGVRIGSQQQLRSFEALGKRPDDIFAAITPQTSRLVESGIESNIVRVGQDIPSLGIRPKEVSFGRISSTLGTDQGSIEFASSFRGTPNRPTDISAQIVKFPEQRDVALITEYKQGRTSSRGVNVPGNNPLKLDINSPVIRTGSYIGIPSEPQVTLLATDGLGSSILERTYSVDIKRLSGEQQRLLRGGALKEIGTPVPDSSFLKGAAEGLPSFETKFVTERFLQRPTGELVQIGTDKLPSGFLKTSGNIGTESPFVGAYRTGSRREFAGVRVPKIHKITGKPDNEISINFNTGESTLVPRAQQTKASSLTIQDLQRPAILSPSGATPTPQLRIPTVSEATRISQLPTMVGGGGKSAGLFAGVGRASLTSDSPQLLPGSFRPLLSSDVRLDSGVSNAQFGSTFSSTSLGSGLSSDLILTPRVNVFSGSTSSERLFQPEVQPVPSASFLAVPQALQISQATDQVIRTESTVFGNPVIRTSSRTRPRIRRPDLPSRGFIPKVPSGKRKAGPLVTPEVKIRGRFVPISKPVSPDVGLDLGFARTRGSIARTFRLKPFGQTTFNEIKLSKQPPVQIFRAPKGKNATPLTFVERNPYALKGSPGAVRDILSARRSSRRSGLFR